MQFDSIALALKWIELPRIFLSANKGALDTLKKD
jgi:hypothetical protein